ncbi:MAG: Coenzyme F420 hydrogenase/dehydrogenase, beta subunit C-terminal domain [Bacillota bacterium]|nr:Coenzyme F420 hydrogenase/dehydrogenase, beta subunit C-terminal domain [Bacillota bacterium]
MISTIELENKVIKAGLCANCGACQELCPYWRSHQGRTLHFFDCDRENGRCLAFCPRMPLDIAALREQFFAAGSVLPELGPFLGLYLTRAADSSIRANAQHGGTMTALLTLALAEGFIDAAVLTKSQGSLDAAGVLAATEQQIRACAGSSFQIPATLAVLNRELQAGRYHKLGVVGTPCKTLAVYKMLSKPYDKDDHHVQNVAMVFGLFCGWGLDWRGLEQLAERHGDREQLRHMDILPSKYHCLELQEQQACHKVELDEVYPLVKENCRYCSDLTAEFADVSVGGARSADGWEVDKGWNQLIVRSDKGRRLLDLARAKGVLEFKELPEGNLDKLRRAALGKKRTAIANICEKTGSTADLSYLEPSRALFQDLL